MHKRSSDVAEAFLAAYDEHADAIFRFIVYKVSDRERANDLVQETFTRAWNSLRKGTQVRSWKPFLYRIAYHLVVDSYREKKSSSLEGMFEDSGFEIADTTSASAETLAEARRVQSAIRALPETHRDLLLMRLVEELSPKEIASITGLSQNVVSVRIHRGIKLLRESIEHTK